MTIQELFDNLDGMEEEDRADWLRKLIARFSSLSLGSLSNFQSRWIDSDRANGIKRPFADFVKAQNEVVRNCIKMEKSAIGEVVRAKEAKKEWNMEEEL